MTAHEHRFVPTDPTREQTPVRVLDIPVRWRAGYRCSCGVLASEVTPEPVVHDRASAVLFLRGFLGPLAPTDGPVADMLRDPDRKR